MAAIAPHHHALPEAWTLLCGREPRDHYGLKSDKLQVIYNCTTEPWIDTESHAHSASDEVYIVLEGVMSIDVEGTVANVSAGEFLCVPAGAMHRLVDVTTPLRSFVVRAPSVDDKVHNLPR